MVLERGVDIHNEFWIVNDSTVELPVMIGAIIKASVIMALILIILNWML